MESLHHTFGAANVDFRRMQPGEYISTGSNLPQSGKVSLKFYLLDCILDRRVCLRNSAPTNQEDKKTKARLIRGDVNEVPWKVPCKSESDMHVDNDYKFVHAITVVPDAMIFYTYMERFEDVSLSLDMSLVPMGISWLRLLGTKDGWFAKGGYVRYLTRGDSRRTHATSRSKDDQVSAWVIDIYTAGRQADVCRLHAFQCPDLYGPRWPPNIFPKEAGYIAKDIPSQRNAYLKLLNQSNTTRIGGRWHVPGTRYSRLSLNALVISPKLHGPHDINVSIQRSDDEILGIHSKKTRDINVICESSVIIRYLNPTNEKIRSYLKAITTNANTLRLKKPAPVRNESGDQGLMFALGCRIDPSGKGIIDYAANKHVRNAILPNAVEAMEYLGYMAFPSIMRPIQDIERVAGCECLPCMEKLLPIDPSSSGTKHLHESMTSKQEKPLRTCQVGLTMDVSSNLCNSAHYDVNDASTGFAVWTETIPGNRAQKWYFVLPNVYGKRHDGTTYEGVAVELEHGVAISWDGRQVKHCSFYIENTKSPLNYLYGTFCGTKFNLIDLGLDGKGQIYDEPENETQTTSPASPNVASLPVHDDSDDEGDDCLSKPIPKKSMTYSGVHVPRDKMKAGLGKDPATNTTTERVGGSLSEPIPKKHMKTGAIDDNADRKVASVQKKSPTAEAPLDYATMRARCFPIDMNSKTQAPEKVVDVTHKAAPTTPTEIAILPPQNKTPVAPPTTKVPHSSPYEWWMQLDHRGKLKFLIDDENTTGRQGGPHLNQPDLDLILEQSFPKYVLSPPPTSMMIRIRTAVQDAVKSINMYYDEAQAIMDNVAALADSDEDSRQSSGYSSDSTFQGKPVKPRGTYYWGKFVHRENAIEFIQALPRLLLTFTCSFHARTEDDQQCVCPCSYKAVRPWMDKLMDAGASSCIAASFETAKCNKKKARYTARSLLSHLHGSNDPIHQAVHVYVSRIYSHFYTKNTHHEALYPINSSDYNRAIDVKSRTRICTK